MEEQYDESYATCGPRHYYILPFVSVGVVSICTIAFPSDFGEWYDRLKKSSLNPHRHVFKRVWFMVYLMLTLAIMYIYMETQRARALAPLFFLQLIFNVLWAPLFTHARAFFIALVDLCITIVLTLTLLIRTFQVGEYTLAWFVFVPYLSWLCCASYLNLVVVRNNSTSWIS